MLCHIITHYDENIHHKCIAMSAATSTKIMTNLFVTSSNMWLATSLYL
jgi:hypothetical protein